MKEIIIYREGLIQSILADTFTFAVLVGSFGVNHLYIGSKILSVILVIMFMFFVIGKGLAKRNVFTDKKSAIDFINEEN